MKGMDFVKLLTNNKLRFLGLALLCSFIFYTSGCKKTPQWQVETPEVTVVNAKKEKIKLSSEYIGQAVAYDYVKLHPRVRGFLEKRNFIEGQYVKKGQILFQIEKAQYEIAVMAAQGNLDKAQDILNNATINYNRYKDLVPSRAVSEKEYDNVRSQYYQAKATMLIEKAALENAQLNLSYTDIKAPLNGCIGISKAYVGMLVGPELFYLKDWKPLAELVQYDPIHVEFNVPESEEVSRMEDFIKSHGKGWKSIVGTKLVPDIIIKLILSNGQEYTHKGEIDYVGIKVNPLTGTVLVRARFENTDYLLLPGAFVTVIKESKFKTEEIIIPQIAIQEDQAGKYVLTVDKNSKIEIRHVKIGAPYKTGIVIKSGLKEGESVVIKGLQMVQDGMKVKAIPEKTVTAVLHTGKGRK
jgi:membrane fusion protein, multidrug efflux system